MHIAVNEPLLDGKEAEYVAECIRTGWISSAGRFIDAFEREWAGYCGATEGVACANGSVAIELALEALDLKPGDEVIMPSFTIISCAQAALYAGLKPVLVDCDPDTLCMNVDEVTGKITSRTRVIMPVHMYGHPCDMDPLLDIARAHDLYIVEDAAESHGATYKSCRTGGIGDVACFSFYANKLITTGEGGMAITSDPTLAKRMRAGRNLCFRPERRFYHTELGHNYRLTNVQAAMGLAQVERMASIVARKRRMGDLYNQGLAGLEGVQLPVERPWAQSVYWMYGLIVNEALGEAVSWVRALAEKGIETRPFFLGMHEQPAFHELGLFQGERYPVTERAARQGFYVPSGLSLTDDQIDTVISAIREVHREAFAHS